VTPVATIDEVQTGDVAPVAPPHRISDKGTKNTATVKLTPHDAGLVPHVGLVPGAPLVPGKGLRIEALRISDSVVGPYVGQLVDRVGLVCSEQVACSEALPCSDWSSPPETQFTRALIYPASHPADGPYNYYAWVNQDGIWR
jgi:hypothetical protein